jgi:hypothetical protein
LGGVVCKTGPAGQSLNGSVWGRMCYSGTLAGLLRDTYWEMSRISDIVAAGAVPCPVIPGDEVRAPGGA